MRLNAIFSLLVLSLALGGCFGSSADTSSDPTTSGLNYYYSEFSDVAIPNEMSPSKADTFITYTGEGVKLGTQLFKGQVEIASLVNAMQGHMQRDGWSLRSVFRASTGAILIFEQQQKMCSMYVFENLINTGMLIFVSPKLGDGALQYVPPTSAITEPLGPADPVIGSSASAGNANTNVTVYPAR